MWLGVGKTLITILHCCAVLCTIVDGDRDAISIVKTEDSFHLPVGYSAGIGARV